MYDFLAYFIAVNIIFFLFYFNAPYWEGKKMYKLSENGIWRKIYYILSYIGYGLYKLIETLAKAVIRQIFIKLPMPRRATWVQEIIINIVNVVIYILVIYGCMQLYELVCGLIIYNNELMESYTNMMLKPGHGGVSTRIVEISSFFEVFKSLTIDGSVIEKIVFIVQRIVMLTIWNIVFYSILFGLLRFKLKEVNLVGYLRLRSNTQEVAASEQLDLIGLGNRVKHSIYSFLSEKTMIYSLMRWKVIIVFWILMLAYCFVTMRFGQVSISMIDVMMEIVDELELVNIFVSFIITFSIAVGAKYLVRRGVTYLPEEMQERLEEWSEEGNDWVEERDEERFKWFEANDNTANCTEERFYHTENQSRSYNNAHNRNTNNRSEHTYQQQNQPQKSENFRRIIGWDELGKRERSSETGRQREAFYEVRYKFRHIYYVKGLGNIEELDDEGFKFAVNTYISNYSNGRISTQSDDIWEQLLRELEESESIIVWADIKLFREEF